MNTQAARLPASAMLHPERQLECAGPHARELPGPLLIQPDDLWHGPTVARVTPSRLVLCVSGNSVRYSDRHGVERVCELRTFQYWAANARLMARAR